MSLQLRFLNPRKAGVVTRNRLPHWEQDGVVVSVTFRLADSIPEELMQQWLTEKKVWLRQHPEPWTWEEQDEHNRLFTQRLERWLDDLHGSCALRSGELARIVGDSLEHFHAERYDRHAWVVMPNHVHVVFSMRKGFTLASILHSWKSYTAKAINERLGLRGAFWQKDYFDRLVRDEDHFANCIHYLRNNPIKAKLKDSEYLHYEAPEVTEYIGRPNR